MSHITEKKLSEQPKRLKYAISQLNELGFDVSILSDSLIQFYYNGNRIQVFPYSGWFCGKGIKDGRGIHNLLKQLNHARQ